PADGETAPPPGPGRTKEPAVESRKPKARLQGRVADDAIAEYSTGSGYARARKVIGREARRCDARPRRRKGPPGEIASSERSNAATADTRAADRTSDKPQTPTPPPRPATPLALSPPTCPRNPPPLPPPPGPASAAGGIVRSKIAAVAMPLIRRALAGVVVFSVAARVRAKRG